MGTPIPESVESGNDCALCTPPAGSLWEPGKTPKVVYAYFCGIAKCDEGTRPPPNGQTQKLTQSPVNNCLWTGGAAGFQTSWQCDEMVPDNSRLWMIEAISGLAYFSSRIVACPEEPAIYPNQLGACLGFTGGTGGVAVIHWMGVVLALVTWMSLPSSNPIMHEIFIKDETTIVHKFCMPKYCMNVKLLMSP